MFLNRFNKDWKYLAIQGKMLPSKIHLLIPNLLFEKLSKYTEIIPWGRHRVCLFRARISWWWFLGWKLDKLSFYISLAFQRVLCMRLPYIFVFSFLIPCRTILSMVTIQSTRSKFLPYHSEGLCLAEILCCPWTNRASADTFEIEYLYRDMNHSRKEVKGKQLYPNGKIDFHICQWSYHHIVVWIKRSWLSWRSGRLNIWRNSAFVGSTITFSGRWWVTKFRSR